MAECLNGNINLNEREECVKQNSLKSLRLVNEEFNKDQMLIDDMLEKNLIEIFKKCFNEGL